MICYNTINETCIQLGGSLSPTEYLDEFIEQSAIKRYYKEDLKWEK